jgi:hypothetical protein
MKRLCLLAVLVALACGRGAGLAGSGAKGGGAKTTKTVTTEVKSGGLASVAADVLAIKDEAERQRRFAALRYAAQHPPEN